MYPYHAISANSYEFLTDSGITYVVEFSNAGFYFGSSNVICNRIEAINFYPVLHSIKSKDPQISETLVSIIKNRCISRNGAVIYVCDSLDKKDFYRSRLFEKWNDIFNNGNYHFQAAIVEYAQELAYAGMIVDVNNPDALAFLTEFKIGIQSITSK